MTNNGEQTAVEWLIQQFYDNEGMLTTKQLLEAQIRNQIDINTAYNEGKEAGIIISIAHYSTEQASKKIENNDHIRTNL